MTRWTALLLAGSRPSGDPLARSMMVRHKALIPIAGEPMVLRPLRALLDSREVGDIVVLTQHPDDLRPVLPKDARVSLRGSEDTIAATIARLIKDGSARFPVLVTTADHALLDAGMIAEFTAKAENADLAIGVVERKPVLDRFPHTRRTWLRFRGGAYTAANLFAFGSAKVLPAIERWRAVEQDRKKGWRVLAAVGPALLLGAVLRLRTLEQSVRSVGRKLGLDIRAVELSNPLAAIDVDKPEDHALVEQILSGRA
ncbi:MAG TPA: NTP transferase domain-containing protein [Sphingomicrobium sp.]